MQMSRCEDIAQNKEGNLLTKKRTIIDDMTSTTKLVRAADHFSHAHLFVLRQGGCSLVDCSSFPLESDDHSLPDFVRLRSDIILLLSLEELNQGIGPEPRPPASQFFP
jgi:hypothetical protein